MMFDCPVCGHKKNIPPTNADHIRAMSDEELARVIGVFVRYKDCINETCGNCDQCPLIFICDVRPGEELDWLKQPVKDGEDK